MRIISGRYAGRTGTVDANVFQRTVDYPKDAQRRSQGPWLVACTQHPGLLIKRAEQNRCSEVCPA